MNLTKLIAAVIAIIGLLSLKAQPFNGVLVIAIAAILFFMPKKTADLHWKLLVDSLHKKALLVALFDALFFAAAASASWFFGTVFKDLVMDKIAKINFNNQALLSSPELATQNVSLTKEFFTGVGVSATLYIICLLVLYAISRAIIWSLLANKKINFNSMKRFFMFSIVWLVIFIIPAWLLLQGLKQEFFAVGALILFALYGHLTAIAHYSFIKTLKIKESIKTAFSKGLGEFSQFVIPYAYLLVVLLITTKVLTLLPKAAYSAGVAIYFILYLGWYRYYITGVFRRKLTRQRVS